MNISIVTVSTAVIKTLLEVEKEIKSEYPEALNLTLINATRKQTERKAEWMKSAIVNADAVIVDLMGSPETVIRDVHNALDKTKGNIIPFGRSGASYLKLGNLSAESMMAKKGDKKPSMESMKKMAKMAETMGKVMPGKMRDMKNLSYIRKYFSLADDYNIKNMLFLLLKEYGNNKDVPNAQKPFEIPDMGIRNPMTKQYYDDVKTYAKEHGINEEKPFVAVLYYGHTYPNDTAKCVSQVIEKIEVFADVLPIAFSSSSVTDHGQLQALLSNNGVKKVDLIINFMSFRLGAGPMGGNVQKAVNLLEETNVPYLHPFFLSRRTEEEWMESKQGVNSSEFMISVMLPELDGCIETIPVGAICNLENTSEFELEVEELTIIGERVEKLVARIDKHLTLRVKQNNEKKIAIICYNYPPGESNVFGGAFLDTFESIHHLLKQLQREGYKTDVISAKELIKLFTTDGIVNSARYFDGSDKMIRYEGTNYEQWLKKQKFADEMVNQWGQAPGDIMVDDNQFLIPGIEIGNVFIGLQPTRGIHEHQDKAYHDKEVLPHHQYIAYYQWLENEFEADAMIHVGTHGTLEFLQGKECGMSANCFPDKLIGSIPHMYLYYAGNPSEAMIAKRRSSANIISYQPTEYVVGELYGEFAELKAMIDEYRQSELMSPVRSKEILENIIKRAEENHLPCDIEQLEHELFSLERSLIPKGLHTFGIGYTKEQSQNYVKALLRYDRNDVKSLRRIIAEDNNYDYDLLLEKDKTEALRAIDETVDTIVLSHFEGKGTGNYVFNHAGTEKNVIEALQYADQIMVSCKENAEISGLLKTLNGEYNRAKLAGDIYRNPEVMPTGYNLYQFDPRFVPSTTAYQRGVKIADNTLNQFIKEDGQLPKSTAVILWGLETSRTQGETVAQILAYLGVRIASNSSMWEPKYEIIPIEELGRNRVDVVVTICGFFRDMFPNLIDNINKVLAEIARLDETDEQNPFKANSRNIYTKLLTQGMDEEQARELAIARIFGPKEAQYGTGITKLIETKNWQDESQIGDQFIESIKHVYTPNYRGLERESLYKANLESVEIVSQIRSNHEYEVTDLDHYYEFFGGLAKSIENVKKQKVKIYITDTTAEKIETKHASKAISRGIQSRLLNPKWINGMLEHKHHGGTEIATRFENVMGLAATTGEVEEWIYDDMFKTYVADKELQQRVKDNNPYAYVEIIEQMVEYNRRGYWDATDEQLQELKQAYLNTEGDIEGAND